MCSSTQPVSSLARLPVLKPAWHELQGLIFRSMSRMISHSTPCSSAAMRAALRRSSQLLFFLPHGRPMIFPGRRAGRPLGAGSDYNRSRTRPCFAGCFVRRGMKKAVILYWSRTGNNERAAVRIRAGLEAGAFAVTAFRVEDAKHVDFFECRPSSTTTRR